MPQPMLSSITLQDDPDANQLWFQYACYPKWCTEDFVPSSDFDAYIEHQKEVVVRRTRFDKEKRKRVRIS